MLGSEWDLRWDWDSCSARIGIPAPCPGAPGISQDISPPSEGGIKGNRMVWGGIILPGVVVWDTVKTKPVERRKAGAMLVLQEFRVHEL